MIKTPKRIFISYSHRDEKHKVALVKHLASLTRQGYVEAWTDQEIVPGEKWEKSINDAINNAHIILLLVSADFLNSDYCNDIELKNAISRHQKGETKVIPIIIKYCDWKYPPLSELQVLPKNAVPIENWKHEDEAFLDVVQGVKKVIESLSNQEEQNKTEYKAQTQIDELEESPKELFKNKKANLGHIVVKVDNFYEYDRIIVDLDESLLKELKGKQSTTFKNISCGIHKIEARGTKYGKTTSVETLVNVVQDAKHEIHLRIH